MFVSDEDLMMKCGKGDTGAFELLVRRYQNPLINYIHRSIDDYHRSEDLSQETFLRVFKSANRYEPTASFRSWLYTIATNLCRNEIRNRSRRNTCSLESLVEEGEDVYHTEIMRDTRYLPDILLEKKEQRQLIRKALAQLPENQRVALTLVTYQDLRYEEVAEILGCSVGAVKALIHRARQKMKKLLIKAGIGEERVDAKI
ncbi:sigma-70 family RNA polymerase sigma factor [Candidatus Poribacteria bacterium]|nr:sigma-70 family RNA polymerase sigma factor [Candidatus Poribacteria bacterium]MYB00154.1 sigma-70 family RNA polymerase sigma factor [Candidatus Poribacteria bacterium]